MNYNKAKEESIALQSLLGDTRNIIETARSNAYIAVNIALIKRNWLLGQRIANEEMSGSNSTDYGKKIINSLAAQLTQEYGAGFSRTNLYQFVSFHKCFSEIIHTVCGQSSQLLSWSHYRILLQVDDRNARNWYEHEAYSQTWSVRTLQRNISSQYYHRLLQSHNKQAIETEMKALTANTQTDKLEFIKSPVVAEFLGLAHNSDFTESKLESCIISHIQKFLMELGKGYAFVERQQHIHTEKQDYYIDLVFYNYFLKCFVLVDLKTSKLSHQDVGQMDMYIRMYDDMKRANDDNPTLGIILCADTDEDIARFSILNGNEQLFASKYLTYLPDKGDLRREIEREKILFQMSKLEKEQTEGK